MAAWDEADMSLLPPRLREQMQAYVERGVPPGPFLTALLAGQPREMFHHMTDDRAVDPHTVDADLARLRLFRDRFVPTIAHGTVPAVQRWIRRGGLFGGAARRDD